MTITNNASSDTITFASSGGIGAQSARYIKNMFILQQVITTTFSGSDDANGTTLSHTPLLFTSDSLNGVLLENLEQIIQQIMVHQLYLVNGAAASGPVIQICNLCTN